MMRCGDDVQAVLAGHVRRRFRCELCFLWQRTDTCHHPPAAEAARGGEHERRLRRHEEVLEAPGELRQPVGGRGMQEE